MEKDELRRILWKNRTTIKELMPTNMQVALLKTIIKIGRVTSGDISKKHKITIQNSSGQLNRLYLKGYLRRKTVIALTGGVEYLYEYSL